MGTRPIGNSNLACLLFFWEVKYPPQQPKGIDEKRHIYNITLFNGIHKARGDGSTQELLLPRQQQVVT